MPAGTGVQRVRALRRIRTSTSPPHYYATRPQVSPEHTAYDAPGGTYAVPRAGPLQSGDVDQRDASLKDRHGLSGQYVYMHGHSPRHMHKRTNSSHVSSRLTWLDPQRAPCEARCLYCTFLTQFTRYRCDFICRPSVATSLRVTCCALRGLGRCHACTLPSVAAAAAVHGRNARNRCTSVRRSARAVEPAHLCSAATSAGSDGNPLHMLQHARELINSCPWGCTPRAPMSQCSVRSL